MANMFFVWKDPNCNGVNPEWIQMTGTEFHEFITKPENSKRTFIKEPIDPEHLGKGFFKMEVTPKEYKKRDAQRKKRERSTDLLDLRRIRYKEAYGNGASGLDDWECDNSPEDYAVVSIDEDEEPSDPYISSIISMEDIIDPNEELTVHDIVADPDVNVEEDALRQIQLDMVKNIIGSFSELEQLIINELFFNNKEGVPDAEIARRIGMTAPKLCKKKKKILEKIRKKVQ